MTDGSRVMRSRLGMAERCDCDFGWSQRRDFLQLLAQSVLGDFQVMRRLQVQPVLRRLTQCASEQQCQFGCDRTRAVYDVRNPHGGNADRTRKVSLRDAKLIERFAEELSGMDGWQTILEHHDL